MLYPSLLGAQFTYQTFHMWTHRLNTTCINGTFVPASATCVIVHIRSQIRPVHTSAMVEGYYKRNVCDILSICTNSIQINKKICTILDEYKLPHWNRTVATFWVLENCTSWWVMLPFSTALWSGSVPYCLIEFKTYKLCFTVCRDWARIVDISTQMEHAQEVWREKKKDVIFETYSKKTFYFSCSL